MSSGTSTAVPFDPSAQSEIDDLLRSNRSRGALERLARYEPIGRVQEIHYFRLRAKAFEHQGSSGNAVKDWVRALHRTSRMRQLRSPIRISLADGLSRMGDLARAERIARRCVTEIRAAGEPADVESCALATLARVLARRGTLSLATRLYERAIELDAEGPNPSWWFGTRLNYAHALIRLGEFTRARGVLEQLDRSERQIGGLLLAAHSLTWVTLALDTDDFEGARRALARVSEAILGDHVRYRLVWLQYRAALLVADRKPKDALEVTEQALEICRAGRSDHDDIVAELSRWRAIALLELGRPNEALQSAREAVQASGGSDRLDTPAGLRVEARCLAALGRKEEARARLAAALSDLDATDFIVERHRLYGEMESLGMSSPRTRLNRTRRTPPHSSIQRLALADGRCFLTSDSQVIERIRRAAESGLPVLIEGETGTGKERVARLLHQLAPDPPGPFVVVDCTTLSDGLAEAELFGVARGAYTGATLDRGGLVAAAHGGTLLFDELPQLSLSTQSKLLRLLQEGTYRRLGEARTRNVSVRVVATTNQDPEHLLATGQLKSDLFFRLNGHRIVLRPLRERPEDIALLAAEFAKEEGLSGFLPRALSRLATFAWAGNVRQLEMLVRVIAAELGKDRWVEEEIVQRLLEEAPRMPVPSAERSRLQAALDRHGGNVAATARSLPMSRQGLYKALRRHGLI